MSKASLSRAQTLEDISSWSYTKVVDLLKNNGVQQACWEAVEKRKINGDELLHLTEGRLKLWKNDLSEELRRILANFVEELNKCPEKYVEDKQKPAAEPEPPPQPPAPTSIPPLLIELQQQQSSSAALSHTETESDTGWDTDFEDSVDEPPIPEIKTNCNLDFRNSLKMFQENDRLTIENFIGRGSLHSINKLDLTPANHNDSSNSSSNSVTYANCEMTYANVGYAEDTPELKNSSKLHSTVEQKSLAEKLKEELLLRGTSLETPLSVGKPTVTPKPEGLGKRTKEEVILRRSEPRTSFLHKKTNGMSVAGGGGASTGQKKMTVAPPPDPATLTTTPKQPPNNNNNNNNSNHTSTDENSLRNLPKPPVLIRGFDLVANLPTTRPADDSDDEEIDERDYEAFDEQIFEQHQRNSLMSRTDSGQSLSSPDRNSIGSAYHPASSVSQDDEDANQIYEMITETPEENGRDYKGQSNVKNQLANPPPLPLKPPPNNTALHNQLNKADSKSERSLDKKSATLPHSGSNLSLNNAARPLPPPPEHRDTYYERPWFHNLTREQANILIEEQCTYHNGPDGYFLMRPSTTNPNNPLTLVLWCKDRVYNVPVRRRPDNRYSLGKAKPDEQSFASIDDIVPFYKKEKLVLYTGGVQTGSTKLSDTPPKEKLNNF